MKSRFIIILSAVILFQCAKQTSPSGGPQDKTPPKLTESNPAKEAINFKDSEIQLTFDEYVQLKNPLEEIIITPSIGKKFEVTAKRNKVTLKLKTPLKDSTTYSVNFREAIQDITERNPSPTKLAFSTGPYIDSLSIKGNVNEILTGNPVQSSTVALVPASDTFNIFKHQGTWLTLTNKQGLFELENLKPGDYFLYAFTDRNKNLQADAKTEPYGFKLETIHLVKNVDSVTIGTQKLDASKLKIISSRPTFAYFNIRASKSIIDYKISTTDTKITSKLESDLTTVKVYNTIPELDSLQIRFEATDSTNNKVDSLIYLKFDKKLSTRDEMKSETESAKIFESNSTFKATINYSKPIAQFLTDSVYIKFDSANRINFSETDFTWNETRTKLSIFKKIDLPKQPQETGKTNAAQKTGDKYELALKKGAAISIENDTASSMTPPVEFLKIKDHAIISVSIKSNENLIVQLLNQSFKVLEQTTTPGIYKFENVPPGSYKIRVQVDLNKNGKWDTGSFQTKQPPEPVFFYVNPKGGRDFAVKANWHVGDLLITY